ncbi:hypothetical protein QQG55_55225 [Brugia pahangi]
MTSEQRSEYSRLIIEIAATKTEISTIRERTRGNSDAIGVTPQPAATTTSRFGDSILDVAARVEQQKLFSV